MSVSPESACATTIRDRGFHTILVRRRVQQRTERLQGAQNRPFRFKRGDSLTAAMINFILAVRRMPEKKALRVQMAMSPGGNHGRPSPRRSFQASGLIAFHYVKRPRSTLRQWLRSPSNVTFILGSTTANLYTGTGHTGPWRRRCCEPSFALSRPGFVRAEG